MYIKLKNPFIEILQLKDLNFTKITVFASFQNLEATLKYFVTKKKLVIRK